MVDLGMEIERIRSRGFAAGHLPRAEKRELRAVKVFRDRTHARFNFSSYRIPRIRVPFRHLES